MDGISEQIFYVLYPFMETSDDAYALMYLLFEILNQVWKIHPQKPAQRWFSEVWEEDIQIYQGVWKITPIEY